MNDIIIDAVHKIIEAKYKKQGWQNHIDRETVKEVLEAFTVLHDGIVKTFKNEIKKNKTGKRGK